MLRFYWFWSVTPWKYSKSILIPVFVLFNKHAPWHRPQYSKSIVFIVYSQPFWDDYETMNWKKLENIRFLQTNAPWHQWNAPKSIVFIAYFGPSWYLKIEKVNITLDVWQKVGLTPMETSKNWVWRGLQQHSEIMISKKLILRWTCDKNRACHGCRQTLA